MNQRFLLMLLVAVVAFGTATSPVGAESPEQVALYESNGLEGWIPASTPLSVEPPATVTQAPDYVAYSDTQPVDFSNPAAQPDTNLWLAQADEGDGAVADDSGSGGGLSISVTNDWVSKYMFRGFDILDDSGAYQPGVEIGLWNSGVTLGWWGSYSTGERGESGRKDLDEHDYYVYWGGNIADCIDVEFGFTYYDFIHLNSQADYLEYYGTFTLSDLPLSPYFGAYYGHERRGDDLGEGWNTVVGVSHSVPLCGLTCGGSDPLALDLAADVWYNGGQYNVDTGWTHATFGGSVTLPLPCNLELTPGLYYQLSMEDTVNDEDEWWATVSLAYSW